MSQQRSKPGWVPKDGGRMTAEMARQMLEAFAASGLSAVAFSRKHGLPKQRISYWRVRLGAQSSKPQRRSSAERTSKPDFVEVIARSRPAKQVALPSRSSMQTLEAALPSGRRIVVHGLWDADSVKTWLMAIEGSRC